MSVKMMKQHIFIIENNLQKVGHSFFHLSRRTTVIQDLLVRRQFSLVPDNRTNVNVEAYTQMSWKYQGHFESQEVTLNSNGKLLKIKTVPRKLIQSKWSYVIFQGKSEIWSHKAKKKYMCVYCHMSKKSRVGRSAIIFFNYRQNRKQSFPVPQSDISFSKFSVSRHLLKLVL